MLAVSVFSTGGEAMLQERTILPIISRVKSIFKKDILDFAILNEHGYRYTHTNILFEYSIDIIKSIERLKKASLPYEVLTINDRKAITFYDFKQSYFVILLDDYNENDTSLSDYHQRLLEVSFFDGHLNMYLKHGAREDYAVVVVNFSGDVLASNTYSKKLFTSELNHIKDIQKQIKEPFSVQELFDYAKQNAVNQMYDVTTLRSVNLIMNAFVEEESQLITFIFTLDAHASFYMNILRGFDFLRVGVVHFELIEENGEHTDARLLFSNMRYTEMMGIELGDRIGKRIFELYPDYDQARFNRYKEVALGAPGLSFEEYVPQIDKYLEIYCYSPRKGEFVNFYYDTSHLYIAKESEQYQIDKIRMMSSFAEMGFFEINIKDKTFECDDYVLQLFGKESMDYKDYRNTFNTMIDPEYKEAIYSKNAQLLEGEIQEGSAIFKVRLNNKEKYLEYYLKTLKRDPKTFKPISILGLVQDVTTEETAKRQIEFYANHDPLTKLYNRHHFNQRVRNKDISLPIDIALLDLDGLKTVNDILGHYAGDEAIVSFVEILNEIYHDAYIARVGGDEFVVLFENGITNPKTRENEVKKALAGVLRFRVPFSVSIGYAKVNHYNEFKEALVLAEDEMYRDKLLERPIRKRKTLKIIYDYINKQEPNIDARSKILIDLSTKLMKEIGYSREDDERIMELIIKYHAIGRIDDYVHGDIYTSQKRFDYYRYLRVETGFKILTTLLPYEKVAEAVLHQCEHFDGSGKPHGRKGSKIPVFSRILSIVFHYYCYLKGDCNEANHTLEETILYLRSKSKKIFDPKILDAFITMLESDT